MATTHVEHVATRSGRLVETLLKLPIIGKTAQNVLTDRGWMLNVTKDAVVIAETPTGQAPSPLAAKEALGTLSSWALHLPVTAGRDLISRTKRMMRPAPVSVPALS